MIYTFFLPVPHRNSLPLGTGNRAQESVMRNQAHPRRPASPPGRKPRRTNAAERGSLYRNSSFSRTTTTPLSPTNRCPPFIVIERWKKKTPRRGKGTSASVPSRYYHRSSLQSTLHTDVLTPVRCCCWLTSIVCTGCLAYTQCLFLFYYSVLGRAGITCCSRSLFFSLTH